MTFSSSCDKLSAFVTGISPLVYMCYSQEPQVFAVPNGGSLPSEYMCIVAQSHKKGQQLFLVSTLRIETFLLHVSAAWSIIAWASGNVTVTGPAAREFCPHLVLARIREQNSVYGHGHGHTVTVILFECPKNKTHSGRSLDTQLFQRAHNPGMPVPLDRPFRKKTYKREGHRHGHGHGHGHGKFI